VKYDTLAVGTAIRTLRERKKKSIIDFSLEIDTSASHLNQLELGNRQMSIQMLFKLMNGLGVDANTILAVHQETGLVDDVSIDEMLRLMPAEKQRYFIGIFKQMMQAYPA